MDFSQSNVLRIFLLITLGLYSSFPYAAANYVFTSGGGLSPNPAGFPGTPLDMNDSNDDNLDVQSGTMSATAGAFTVRIPVEQSGLLFNIAAGATLDYAGSDVNANTLYMNMGQYSYDITISGTIKVGASATNGNAIYIQKPGNNIDFNVTGTIAGNVTFAGADSFDDVSINLDGSSCQFNGAYIGPTNASDKAHLLIGVGANVPSFSTGGAMSNIQDIQIGANGGATLVNVNYPITFLETSLQLDANTVTILNAAVSGTAATTNNGSLKVGAAGSLGTTGNFTNNNKLSLASVMVKSTYTPFVNTTGKLYVVGAGGFTGTLTEGLSLTVGRDYDDTTLFPSTAYTTGGNISGIPILDVYNGNFVANHTIGGITNRFRVFGGTATLNQQLTGAGGDTTIDGNLVYGLNNAVATSGPSNPFVTSSTGKVYLPFQFTPANFSTFTNAGEFYIYGAGSIVGAFNPNPSGAL